MFKLRQLEEKTGKHKVTKSITQKDENIRITVIITIIACVLICNKIDNAFVNKYNTKDINIDVIIDLDETYVKLNKTYDKQQTHKVKILEQSKENKLDTEFIKVVEDNPTYTFTKLDNQKKYTNKETNLRYGPSEKYEIAEKVKINTELIATHSISNGWSELKYKEQTLFCETANIQDEKVYIVPPFDESKEVMKFEGNVSQACRNKAISLYRLLPENVKNAYRNWGYTIVVTSSPSLTQGHCGMYYPIEMNSYRAAGVYAKSINAVNIAVLHETGHFIDNYLGNKEHRGISPNFGYRAVTSDLEWITIYNAEVSKSGFPSYITWCPEEFFAECVWKTLANPSWMKSNLPNAYNYVMSCINRI